MPLKFQVSAAGRRAALMSTAAISAISVSAPAQAQYFSIAVPAAGADASARITQAPDAPETYRPVQIDNIDSPMSVMSIGDAPIAAGLDRARIEDALETRSANLVVDPNHVEDTPSIVINNNFTPNQIFDPTNITGIGQVITDAGGGGIGTCTGTLINRRTVLFAAHCVNTRAATAYGANSGGVGAAVGFETNTRANGPGQVDELVRWLFGTGPDAAGRFQTNTAQALYNVSQIFYHPGSTAPTSCTAPNSCFLEADIAVAVLDTPTRNVPTWTMLFSPLDAPSIISTSNGTGYHVTIAGYGSTGNGTTGSSTTGGFRRRIAENILGGLTSLRERSLFLFGAAGANAQRTQLLYFLDFDDPRRGTAGASANDFNGFRDNALPREGITGPGDSGGPLIIDQAFGQDVRTIIGVLSGGSTFFANQPAGSYGSQNFYQPLFLYWDWIVANNPYRYVTALGGNRNWEDGSTWITELDPAYQVLVNGQLVNGLPTNLGGGKQVTAPQFGEMCIQQPNNTPNPATNFCRDLRSGQERNVPNNGDDAGSALSPGFADSGTVQLFAKEPDGAEGLQTGSNSNAGTAAVGRTGIEGEFNTPQGHIPGFLDTPRPAPTLDNGLPGATNFVPDNFDGVRTTGVSARYFDVTLRQAGSVTLSSAVTIDNFTIVGASSRLNIGTAGALTSLLEVNHLTGVINVNGTLTSRGDYFFMSGLLTGSGRVNAPFLTSVMGNFAPGTLGTIGTLTIGGNLVMSSGTTYVLDLGNGMADRLAIVANGSSTGTANVGGVVLLGRVPGTAVRFGDVFNILTAQGGVTGTFAGGSLSIILRPEFIYTANAVDVRIAAVPFTTVINSGSSVQNSFALLLDQNRSNGALNGIFDNLDFAPDAATIQSTLENLAPRTETLRQAIGIAGLDNNSRMFRDRIQNLRPGDLGGRMAYYGRRVETAAMAVAGLADGRATMSDVSVQSVEAQTRLPETMSGFIAGGYLEGESAPMAGTLPVIGADNFDGFYVAAGLEHELGGNSALGFALSYTDIEGETVAGGQSADGQLYLGTLYGKTGLGRGNVVTLDGQLSVGSFSLDTLRPGNLPGQPITLRSSSQSLAAAAEIGIAAMFGEQVRFGPRLAARVSHIDFGRTTETGGVTALQIERNDFNSVQGRAGLVIEGAGRIRPNLTATYVREFDDAVTGFGANFVGGIGGDVRFDLAGQDRDWFEVAGGVTIETGRVELSLSADTTIERDDVENRSYRAAVKLRF
jgi:uncharacterized protein YhjY with autotransporter beta-barrel domain